jgi:xylan 1,4-beta-xylosidase
MKTSSKAVAALFVLGLAAFGTTVVTGYKAGTPFQVLPCNTSNPRQLYSIENEGTFSEIRIGRGKDPDPTDVIDSAGGGAGTTPHVWSLDKTQINQHWLVERHPSNVVKFIANENTTGYACLSVSSQLFAASVFMQSCEKATGWTYDENVGTLSIKGRDGTTDLCLDAGTDVSYLNCQQPPLNKHPYCDPNLGAEERAKDLISRMALVEKVLNLNNHNPGSKRLGLPNFQYSEALHGVMAPCGATAQNQPDGSNSTGCATSFPHALLLGSSFNRSLWSRVGEAISTEGRSLNNQGNAGLAFWAPDINLFRDPRWGRGQETPGEDPFLNGEYVMHWSRGMQEGEQEKYLKVVSTGKHFADYDVEGNGAVDRGAFNAVVNDQDQVEFYFPAWRAAAEGAHVHSVMCSYNAVNDVPACGNDLFMNGVLREQYQFDGFVVSDCGAIGDESFHRYIQEHYNGSALAQAALGITAGCDLNCGNFYTVNLEAAVKKGVLSESDLDQALERVLKHYIMLGFLDDASMVEYRDINKYGPMQVDSGEHRALAQSAAEQGMVLLKNDNVDGGKTLLPLASTDKVALIGPHFNATEDMISIYHGDVRLVQTHSPFQIISKRGNVIGYAPGCVGTDGDDPDGSTGCLDTTGFDDAVALAKKADIAIVFVGLTPGQMKNDTSDAREDEGWDRHITGLPGHQEALIEAVYKANPKTVVVLIHGAPLSIEWTQANVPSILDAHYPGEMGGDAIASALYGDISPAGRLTTLVYPKDIIKARNISDMCLRCKGGITYKYYTGKPLWEFGFGLSYTTFTFDVSSARSVSTSVESLIEHDRMYYKSDEKPMSPAGYDIKVTNTGNVESECSVLGFVSSDHPDAPVNKELFDFARVGPLKPGASVVVHLGVVASVLSVVDKSGAQTLLPGTYKVEFGVRGAAEGVPAQAELILTGSSHEMFSFDKVRKGRKGLVKKNAD